MTRSSRAVVLTAPGTLEYTAFDLPTIGDFDGLLQVEACGICGTDYEQYAGDLTQDSYRTPYPAVPGHEPVGRITELGRGAAERWGVDVGDRVAVRPVYGCGRCPSCLAGDAAGCPTRGGTYGLTDIAKEPSLWGGYAQFMYLHPLSTVVKVGDHVSASVGTLVNPLACGISWAVTVPNTQPDDDVVILGSGQRGLSSVVAARQAGARSITISGLEKDAYKLELALRLGATNVITVDRDTDVAAEIRAVVPDGAAVVVDTTPLALGALGDAISSVAQRGRIVLAGIKGRHPAPNVFQDDITLKQLSVFGVSATSAADFIAAGVLLEESHETVAQMHTLSFGLEEAEEAVLSAAGADGRAPAIHVALEPNR